MDDGTKTQFKRALLSRARRRTTSRCCSWCRAWTACTYAQQRQELLQWLLDLTEGLSHADMAALASQSKMNAMVCAVQYWFDHDGEQGDIALFALDEIRINY